MSIMRVWYVSSHSMRSTRSDLQSCHQHDEWTIPTLQQCHPKLVKQMGEDARYFMAHANSWNSTVFNLTIFQSLNTTSLSEKIFQLMLCRLAWSFHGAILSFRHLFAVHPRRVSIKILGIWLTDRKVMILIETLDRNFAQASRLGADRPHCGKIEMPLSQSRENERQDKLFRVALLSCWQCTPSLD